MTANDTDPKAAPSAETSNANGAAPQAQPNGEALAPEAANDAGPQAEPDRIAALEAEKTDLKDKLLRILADMENLRRRTEREVADARAYAVTNFARDMLTVADNIRRGI